MDKTIVHVGYMSDVYIIKKTVDFIIGRKFLMLARFNYSKYI